MDDSPLFVAAKLLAVLGLVAANGFFVAAEFSLVGMRRSRVEELEGQGHSTAKILRRAVDHLDANLAATQLGITISSLALGWIGEPALAHLIEPWLAGLGGMATAASHAVAVGVAFTLITVFHIVLGELAPKSLAIQQPERTALWVVRPLGLFLTLFKPAIFLLNGLGNAVLKVCGLEPGHAEGRLHSTEELKLLVAASKEAGLVQQGQQEVVERAFEMGERRVRAIMTPGLDVYWVDADASSEAMLRGIRQSPHEQIVVARGSLDDIVGVLRKQDLLDLHLDGKLRAAAEGDGSEELLGALRKPLVVHDGATVLQVLETFRDQAIQMAVIVDEYGALRGVVTQTDLLEALTGESASDPDERAVKQREDGSFLADGTAPIQEAFDQTGIGEGHDGKGEYRTVAGFVLSHLGRIPTSGDHFEWDGPDARWRFEVVDMDGHRIDKILISREESENRNAGD